MISVATFVAGVSQEVLFAAPDLKWTTMTIKLVRFGDGATMIGEHCEWPVCMEVPFC